MHLKFRNTSKIALFHTFSSISDLKIILLKSTRFWKWAAAHVCRNKNRSTHRTTTPFVSADTHGPKEVFQSKFWILKWFENFFHALQVGLRCSSKSFFLHVVSADFLCKFFKLYENMQKSLPPDVCGPQNQLVLFLSTPRTLLERLGLMLP